MILVAILFDLDGKLLWSAPIVRGADSWPIAAGKVRRGGYAGDMVINFCGEERARLSSDDLWRYRARKLSRGDHLRIPFCNNMLGLLMERGAAVMEEDRDG